MTSRNVTGTLVDVVRLATVVALVLVLAQLVTDEGGIRFVLSAVYLSAVIPILYGIWQHHRGAGFYIGGFVRTFSTFQHPNPFAIYLSMLIIMGVAIWGRVRGWYRFGLSLILLGCGLNLFYTYTRSAWIAALLGVLVVGIIQSKRMIALMWIGVVVIALVGMLAWNVSLRNDVNASRDDLATGAAVALPGVGNVVAQTDGNATLFANLRPAPAGRTYEAWVIRGSAALPQRAAFAVVEAVVPEVAGFDELHVARRSGPRRRHDDRRRPEHLLAHASPAQSTPMRTTS